MLDFIHHPPLGWYCSIVCEVFLQGWNDYAPFNTRVRPLRGRGFHSQLDVHLVSVRTVFPHQISLNPKPRHLCVLW